jgi:hypothetical protein
VIEVVAVVEWLNMDGDQVDAGQPIVVIESEMAETEIETPVADASKSTSRLIVKHSWEVR